VSRRGLTPEDRALWRRVARTVEPRPGRKPPPEEAPRPARPAPKPAAAPRPVTAAAPSKKTPAPADASGERRVRRGKLEIEGRIDLHGLTHDAARAELLEFVAAARRAGKRAILVITGKGKGGDGVLRRHFPLWLRQPDFAAHVSAYAPAHPRHGGAGAFYVKLRRAGA